MGKVVNHTPSVSLRSCWNAALSYKTPLICTDFAAKTTGPGVFAARPALRFTFLKPLVASLPMATTAYQE